MKAPAFQFYPSDWQRDMDDYPLEIEGAWIRICCRLYWSEGKSTKTLDEWSRILREKPKKTEQIFKFFSDKNICDLDNQNGTITLTSRRMVRDAYIRKVRKESGILGGNPQLKTDKNKENLLNQTVNQNPTPSSSSSSSSSKQTKQKNIKNIYGSQFKKVRLLEEEHQKLTQTFGQEKTQEMIDNMDIYLESKGDKYKSHYATLLSWERKNKGGNNAGYKEGNTGNSGQTRSKASGLGDGQPYPVDFEVS